MTVETPKAQISLTTPARKNPRDPAFGIETKHANIVDSRYFERVRQRQLFLETLHVSKKSADLNKEWQNKVFNDFGTKLMNEKRT